MELDGNIILQILNPILASQKMMFSQFDNNYAALLASDNFNIAYEEYFGNVFIRMSTVYGSDVQKEVLYSCVCFARMLCGPNIAALKDESNGTADTLRILMHAWLRVYVDDYRLLLPDCVMSHLLQPDKLNSIMAFLRQELKPVADLMGTKFHALLLYRDDLVCQYSAFSTGSAALLPGDVASLTRLASSVLSNTKTECLSVFLNGNGPTYECIPHVVAITNYTDLNLKLVVCVEADNVELAKSVYKALSFFNKVYNFNIRLDADNVKVVVDKIEYYLKQVVDASKPNRMPAAKSEDADQMVKQLERKWATMKKKLAELAKISYKEVLNNLDASLPLLVDGLVQLFKHVYIDSYKELLANEGIAALCEVEILNSLKGYSTILAADQQNALIKTYMEEFPGLIHFMFVNKSTGRIIAPTINDKRTIIDKATVS